MFLEMLKNRVPPPSWAAIVEAVGVFGSPMPKERLKSKYCNKKKNVLTN